MRVQVTDCIIIIVQLRCTLKCPERFFPCVYACDVFQIGKFLPHIIQTNFSIASISIAIYAGFFLVYVRSHAYISVHSDRIVVRHGKDFSWRVCGRNRRVRLRALSPRQRYFMPHTMPKLQNHRWRKGDKRQITAGRRWAHRVDCRLHEVESTGTVSVYKL